MEKEVRDPSSETKRGFDLSSKLWLIAAIVGLLAFVGLALPLVSAHPNVTVEASQYEWDGSMYWDFSFDSDSRGDIWAGILFGLSGAVVWPTLVCYCMILLGAVLCLFGRKSPKFLTAAMLLYIVAGVLLLLSNNFYAWCNALVGAGEYGSSYYDYVEGYMNEVGARLGVGAIFSAVISFAAAVVCFSGAMEEERMTVADMTEISMLCAVAIVLDVVFHYVPNISGQAGSISIATLPLYLIALRHGPAKGFLASGLVYGLITCFTDGYGLFLYPLDYLVAFGGICIIGFFQKWIIGKDQTGYNLKGELFILLSVILSAVVRMVGSCASSMFNYGYSFTAALVANGIYIPVSALICGAVLMGAYGPILKLNAHFPTRKTLAND